MAVHVSFACCSAYVITVVIFRPLFLGTPLFKQKDDVRQIFPAGGSGYTLNRAALQLLQTNLDTYFPNAIDPREDAWVVCFLV
jgi:hypothetical protein